MIYILTKIDIYKRSVFFVLLGALSFGCLSSIVKIAYSNNISSNYITFSQFFYGSVLFLIPLYFIDNKIKTLMNIRLKNWNYLLLSGLSYYLSSYFYNITLTYLYASTAIILLFQYTWMCVLFDIYITKKLPSKNLICGVFLLLIGTILANDNIINGVNSLNNEGIFFGLLSALTFTLYIYFNKKTAVYVKPLIKSFLIISIASFFSIVTILLSIHNITNISYLLENMKVINIKNYILVGLIIGLFGSLLPTYFLTIGSTNLSMGLVSILSSIELPIVILTSYIFLKEKLSIISLFGITLILIGICISQIVPQQLKR